MTEEKKKDESAEIEEKRIKPAVIRRRKAVPKKEAKAPEAAATDAVATEAVATEAAAPESATKKAATKKAATTKKAGATKKATTTKAATTKKATTKKAATTKEAATEKKAATAKEAATEKKAVTAKEATTEKASVKKAAATTAPGAAPHKKEVKVFKPEERRPTRPDPVRQVFRKGKRRFKNRPQRRPRPQIQATRPLMKTEITVTKAGKRVIRIDDAISVADLSQRLGVKANDIIRKLMDLDIMATVNQFIDVEAATIIAGDFDYEVANVAFQEGDHLDGGEVEAKADAEAGELVKRSPVVTVMGHVDHGKTSLLDAIRKTNVASGEAGGITQHIGAYHVHIEKGDVTFLDTPGHEAFTAMRARGAKVTDIVVLVVAADDGIMPQTVEAINHAKAAGVPIIVAINKIDLPQADAEKVNEAFTEPQLARAEWGGDTIFVEVSAKQGKGVKELIEIILLQAEMLELKASVKATARGVIVEAKLDKGRGAVSTVLISSGTLKTGDAFVTGVYSGRVRAMTSDRGKRIDSAGPSMPVEIMGFTGVPDAGDDFIVVKDEAASRQIADIRQHKRMEEERRKTSRVSLTDLFEQASRGDVKELGVIIKGDVQGSIEAVKDALLKIKSDLVTVNIIHSGAGGVSEGDVMLASASNAIIIGFNIRPEPKARRLAEAEGVEINLYSVIYNLLDDIRNAMEGLLEPIKREEPLGRVEVREVFKVTGVGTVAGSYVTEGKIQRSAKLRLVRDSVVIFEGDVGSLRRFKDDVKEVASGYECGVSIANYNDVKVGDVIEAYVIKEEAAKL